MHNARPFTLRLRDRALRLLTSRFSSPTKRVGDGLLEKALGLGVRLVLACHVRKVVAFDHDGLRLATD